MLPAFYCSFFRWWGARPKQYRQRTTSPKPNSSSRAALLKSLLRTGKMLLLNFSKEEIGRADAKRKFNSTLPTMHLDGPTWRLSDLEWRKPQLLKNPTSSTSRQRKSLLVRSTFFRHHRCR